MSFKEALVWPFLDLGGRCRKNDPSIKPKFLLSKDFILKRNDFLKSCLLGSFNKWVGSSEAIKNWAMEEWG